MVVATIRIVRYRCLRARGTNTASGVAVRFSILARIRRRYPRPPFSDKSVRTRTHSRSALSTSTTTRSNHALFIPYDTGHDLLLGDKSSAARNMPNPSDNECQDDDGHEIVMKWNEI